jgi:hypothetical protein
MQLEKHLPERARHWPTPHGSDAVAESGDDLRRLRHGVAEETLDHCEKGGIVDVS